MRLKYAFTTLCMIISLSSIAQTWNNFNNFSVQKSSDGRNRLLPSSGSGNVPIYFWDKDTTQSRLDLKQVKLPVTLDTLSNVNSLYFDGYVASLTDTLHHQAEGFLSTLPDGRIINIFRRADPIGEVSLSGGVYKRISSDGGITWGATTLVYKSSYDDRNIAGGITDDGRLVIFFRRANVPNSESIDRGFIYSTDNTYNNYSTYQIITPTKPTGGAPFGRMIKNGDGKYLMAIYSSGWCEIFESTNGTSWTNKVLAWDYTSGEIITTTEPSIEYVGDNKLIAIVRTEDISKTYLQLTSSNNGSTWTKLGYTNHNNGNWSVSPLIYYDPIKQVVISMASERKATSMTTDKLRIYSNTVASIFSNPTGYVLKKEYLRPLADSRAGLYGYPSITKRLDSNYLVVFTDRYTKVSDNVVTANQRAFLYQFTIKHTNLYFGQNIPSDYSTTNYLFNPNNGKYEPNVSQVISINPLNLTNTYSDNMEVNKISGNNINLYGTKTTVNLITNGRVDAQGIELGRGGSVLTNSAPIKFKPASSALNNVPEAGAMEVDGVDRIYYTGVPGVRNRLAYTTDNTFVGNGFTNGGASTAAAINFNTVLNTSSGFAGGASTNPPLSLTGIGGTLSSINIGNQGSQTFIWTGAEDSFWFRRMAAGGAFGSWFQAASRTYVDASNTLKQNITVTNNSLTTAQTSSTLNSSYPTASVGDQVMAPNVGTGMLYIKVSTTSGGQWRAFSGSSI